MVDRTAVLTGRLHDEGKKTVEFFRKVRPDQWDLRVYSEGASWQVREVLMHFVSSERGVSRLVELIVEGAEGVPENFRLDEYNERKVTQLREAGPDSLIDEFTALRGRTEAMVSNFSEDDLDKVGRHPFLGLAKVEDMIKLMYRHNQIHQRDIRRVLSKAENGE